MKHTLRIFLFSVLVALVGAEFVYAAPPKKATPQKKKQDKAWYTRGPDLHFFSMWGGVGYSGLVGNYSTVDNFGAGTRFSGSFDQRFIGGGGGLFGVGYELHHHSFLFSVGPELRFFSSRDNIAYTANVIRDDYSSITQYYTLDKYRETQSVGQVMLPVMFGGNFERYYFLAGAKVGYTFMGNFTQRGGLTTYVKEVAAIDPWENQQSRNWQSVEDITEHSLFRSGNKGKNSWGLDVALSAEFGVNLNEFFSKDWNKRNEDSAHPWRMRVGAFIDYGMPILSSSDRVEESNLMDVPVINELGGSQEPGYFTTRSLHQTGFADKKLSSLLVGVKFTALFQLNKIKQPNPRMVFVATDNEGNPLKSVASVLIKNEDKPRQKPKTRSLGRGNSVTVRYPKANYAMLAQAAGYLPSDFSGDTLRLAHYVDLDTVYFRLIPMPRLLCYTHNAETEQYVAGSYSFVSQTSEGHNKTVSSSSSVEQPAMVSLHYGDSFRVRVSAEGYHDTTAVVSQLTDTLHFYLRPIHRVRRTLLLKHIYFDTDKTEILPMSENDLSTLYSFLNENPKIRVLITGHTDSKGSASHNQVLSEGRAASVKAAMVKRGISADRMETNGKGESEPIDTNDTEIGRQNNRRVQVTVLNADEAEEDVW